MRCFIVGDNKSFSREARNIRKQANRRIARLEKVLNDEKTTSRNREWARRQIADIRQAQNESKLSMNIRGHRYTQTIEQAMTGLKNLKTLVSEIEPRFTLEGDNFEVTQRELNRASVNLPSIYTKNEVKIFYRATQKIWQKKDVDVHERNEAILNYYNEIRMQNKLAPVNLNQIVDAVLKVNKEIKEQLELEPEKPMTEEQEERYSEAQKGDTADHSKNSPIDAAPVQDVRDAMEELFLQPNPLMI